MNCQRTEEGVSGGRMTSELMASGCVGWSCEDRSGGANACAQAARWCWIGVVARVRDESNVSLDDIELSLMTVSSILAVYEPMLCMLSSLRTDRQEALPSP